MSRQGNCTETLNKYINHLSPIIQLNILGDVHCEYVQTNNTSEIMLKFKDALLLLFLLKASMCNKIVKSRKNKDKHNLQ